MGYIWEFINLVGILVQFAGCRFLHADLGADARRDPRQLQTNTTTGQAKSLPRLNVSDGDAMKPYINPLGFIHRLTLGGIRFLLTDPGDSRNLKVGTPVTITQPSSDGLSLAKIRGEIISVGYVTATLTITETILDEGWPQNEETIREKTPVYLAKENSFEPDPSRMLTAEQAERITEISRKYNDILRNPTSHDESEATPPRNHPPTQPPIRHPFPQQLDE